MGQAARGTGSGTSMWIWKTKASATKSAMPRATGGGVRHPER